jgi:transposase InsO family protein
VLKKLDVSKSGYYDYLKRKPSKTKQRREKITEKVKTIYKESYGIYGSPKITQILKKQGEKVSQRYIHSILKENNLKARYIKPYTQTTISENFSSKLKNLLNRHFNPTKPDCAWCTDITYIWTVDEGFVYLTSVMDLYSRKIISWVLTKTMEADAVLKCIEIAKRRRKVKKPLVIQSDRGVQYTSLKYQILTDGFITSYSRKGTPWDNACIESFHALIKREWINFYRIMNYNEAYKIVFEYIEGFYNTVRIHSHCDYCSPDEHERKYVLALANTYKNNLLEISSI